MQLLPAASFIYFMLTDLNYVTLSSPALAERSITRDQRSKVIERGDENFCSQREIGVRN